MKPLTLVVVALLIGALFLLQGQVLEKSPEQRLERASQNLGELKASTLLPTYIGSLFLGSFRAVAIDILWIQMQRMREQEHRYFETVEYMDLITRLQPRNPEAWAYMAWDSGYNIANQFRTTEDLEELRALEARPAKSAQVEHRIRQLRKVIPEKDAKYRTWVKRGLLTLVEACRHMPDDPYLHHDIGQTLWSKAAWSSGILEMQFIRAVEEDPELQAILGDGLPPGKKRTPFELAEIWFAKGQARLKALIKEGRFRVFQTLMESMSRPIEQDRQHHTTQMGRNIDAATFVGAIHQMRYLDGILKWYRAREAAPEAARKLLTEASESFSKATDQAMVYRREHSPIVPGRRAYHDARADLCRGLADFCADLAKGPVPLAVQLSRLENIRWAPVDRVGPAAEQAPPPDERYVLDYMSAVKRALGGDAWEYNDDIHSLHRGNFLAAGETREETIAPDLKDEDYHHFYASRPAENPHPGHTHEEPPPAAGPLTSRFHIRCTGDLSLKVTALALNKGRLGAEVSFELARGMEREFPVTSDVEGPVFILVTAASTSGEAPVARGYTLKALGVLR